MATETTRPARRTIVKGAAWAVPAVAVASAAPAHAASPNPCIGDLCFGCASVHKCCSGGPQAMYWACVTFTNDGDTAVDVTFSFTVNTSANGPVPISGGGTVPAGETVSFKPQTDRRYGNCSTGSYASFVIDFEDANGNTGSATVPGGDIDGGGNTCPGNTTCGPCAASGAALTQSQPAEEPTGEAIVEESMDEAPATEEPAVEAPVTEAPAVEEPAAEAPAVEEPAAEAPAVEAPRVEEPTVDTAEVTSAPDVSTDESTENN